MSRLSQVELTEVRVDGARAEEALVYEIGAVRECAHFLEESSAVWD